MADNEKRLDEVDKNILKNQAKEDILSVSQNINETEYNNLLDSFRFMLFQDEDQKFMNIFNSIKDNISSFKEEPKPLEYSPFLTSKVTEILEVKYTDKDALLEAMKKDGSEFKFGSNELKNDREVVMEAVKLNTWNLKYASDEMRSDKRIVLEALEHCGYDTMLGDIINSEEDVLNAAMGDAKIVCYTTYDPRKALKESIKLDEVEKLREELTPKKKEPTTKKYKI